MRHFVRQNIKGGRCVSLNQCNKSTKSDEMFNKISKKLNISGNICDILDEYFENPNKQREIKKEEYDSQFNDYRDNDEEERTKNINEEVNKLAKPKKLQILNPNDVMMDFDATRVYFSPMWDDNSVYPKIEWGFGFKPQMNITYVDALKNQNFIQDGNESAILIIKYYNFPDLIFQHLPVKEKVKIKEVNRMRNGYINDTLTSVDIEEIVKIDGKVIEIYEGVIYIENFKIPPFRKVIEKLFSFRQKYKDEQNNLMQGLVKTSMSSL